MANNQLLLDYDRNLDLFEIADSIRNYDDRSLKARDPVETCEQFNSQVNETMNCVCKLFDKVNVNVNCTYKEPLCASDNSTGTTASTCVSGGMAINFNKDGDEYIVTTCSDMTTGFRTTSTCVDVYPKVVGNFSLGILNCTARLNNVTCNYCHLCNDKTATVDCCNVEEDVKQTKCANISSGGAFIPIFDPTPDPPGQCKGNYTYSRAPISLPSLSGLLAMSFISVLMLLS